MMSEASAIVLLDTIDEIKSDLPVVEIGVFEGKTTSLMANYLSLSGKKNKVIGIDPFEKFIDMSTDKWGTGTGSLKKTLENIDGLENVEIKQGFSFDREIVDSIPYASMIFLDGEHTEESFKKDIFIWLPKTDIFIFHDYNYPSIQRALKSLNLNIKKLGDNMGRIIK